MTERPRARRGARPAPFTTAVVMAGLLALQACSTPPTPATPAPGAVPPASTPAPAPAPAPAAAARRIAALETERRWLQSWFKDTPVVIAADGDTAFKVEVPREFCFDAGSGKVKPALAAVLDKVAESLRRQRQARLELLSAPADGAEASQLALLRAAQMRAHLASRGVPAARLAPPSASATPAVQLRLAVAGS